MMNCTILNIKHLGVPDPRCGDFKLNVMPFEHKGSSRDIKLPIGFELWEETANAMLEGLDVQENATTHYITIDSKFFSQDGKLRREGVHIDGNFCVDPNFSTPMGWGGGWALSMVNKNKDNIRYMASWGGTTPDFEQTDDGLLLRGLKRNWVSEFVDNMPIGDYVSETKGGILTVSSMPGCKAWSGIFEEEIGDGGDCENYKMLSQCTQDKQTLLLHDELYFMSSNTPHETLDIKKGLRRSFLRITLNHNYDNTKYKERNTK